MVLQWIVDDIAAVALFIFLNGLLLCWKLFFSALSNPAGLRVGAPHR